MLAARDARHCLWNTSQELRQHYLSRLYGNDSLDVSRDGEPSSLASHWTWQSADVVWLDLLDVGTAACLLRFRESDGTWTAHTASGLWLPPIGSKMEWPVMWIFHEDRRCKGERPEFGGARGTPTVDEAGSWQEVFQCVCRSRPRSPTYC